MDFNAAIKISTGTATSSFINLNSITTAPTVGTPFSGYIVERVSYSNAGISGFVDSLAQRDGAEADIALLGQRQTQIIVQVYGSSSADFYDKLDAINSALQPYPSFAASDDGFRSLDFTQATNGSAYSSTGIPMRLKVRPQGIPSYSLDNDFTTPRTSDRGISTKVAITLSSKDPRKINQTSITGSFSSAATSATLTNNGNYRAYPTFTIVTTSAQTVAISTPLWTTSISVSAGTTTTVVNAFTRTVTVGGSLNMAKVNSTTTEFPYLPSGGTVVTITPSVGWSGITSLTYSFQEAWL